MAIRLYFLRFALLATLMLLPALANAQMVYQTMEDGITPKEREIWFYGLRAYPFGKIPQNTRSNAIQQAKAKMESFGKRTLGLQSINQWKQIGPTNAGGRINTIAVHPTDGKTLWVGAADGGIWKSTDNGGSWKAVMDNENAISFGALAVDPGNPDVLYAGTGEMSSNTDAYDGAGLFKSTDGGNTWKVAGLTNVGAFSRIVVNPKNSNIVWAGGVKNGGGLYRSDDAGKTWTRYSNDAVSDLTINPGNPVEMWVAVWSKGVFHSTDGGQTMTKTKAGPTDTTIAIGRISVSAAPSDPTVVYAIYEESSVSARVYKSTNSGTSWTRVYNATDALYGASGSTQGWYDQFITVSPNDPNKVVAGGIGLIRSSNGGTSWNYLSGYAGVFHPDLHALTFDPANPDRYYLGNDGGMWRSDNFGVNYTDIGDGLGATQFYAMAIDQSDAVNTYGGTQDNGTVSSTGRGIYGGDGFYVAVDFKSPNIIYGETYNGNLWKVDISSGTTLPIDKSFTDAAGWSAPIVMDPKDNNVLYHGRAHVWKTLDGGANWIEASPIFTGFVSAIGISPVNTDIVYAGSDRGTVMVSKDGGADWTDISTAPGLTNRAVMDFAPSLTDAGTCYIAFAGAYTGHIFKTTDYGASWTDVSYGLPDITVGALAIHPDDPNIIYAGTDIGMFVTTDDGKTWANYNQGMPRVAIADLEVHRENKTLRAATHGRSMWEIDLEKAKVPPSITSPAGGEVWMGGSPEVISWIGFSGPVSVDYSIDDGVNWKPIASNAAGNALRWNVADETTIVARIRVTNMSNQSETATSRTFTIEKFHPGGLLTATTVLITPYGVAYDGQYLWATDFVGTTLLKLDPKTLKTVEAIPTNIPKNSNDSSMFTDITYHPGKGHLYIHQLKSGGGGWLNEVSTDGKSVNRWTSPCQYPIGLAWLGGGTSQTPSLLVCDRNGTEAVYLVDPDNGSTQAQFDRVKQVTIGPRGATSAGDGVHFYQVITDFSGTGSTLVKTTAEKFKLGDNVDYDTDPTQQCIVPIASPLTGGYINARGIEIDTSDKNFWITDLGGNIYKIASCEGKPTVSGGPPGSVSTVPVPAGMTLTQNMPNPFAGSTEIIFTLPTTSRAKLMVYDMNGKPVATLADQQFEGGSHSIRFSPDGLSSGVYRYSLTLESGATISRTMVYVK